MTSERINLTVDLVICMAIKDLARELNISENEARDRIMASKAVELIFDQDNNVSAEAFGRALYSDDMEIAEIAGALYGEMYGEYSEQLKTYDGAVSGYVHRNGVLEPVYYYSDLDALVSYMTLTEKILNQMKTISVGSIDGTVLLGAGGELLAVKGTVCFNVTDRYGRVHTLTVETEVNVTDFGTTDLSGYTPDMWGVPDFSVWWENQQQDYLEEMENVGQPEVITFNGIDYTV